MAAISFSSSLHASASRVFGPHVSRNTPGLALYSRFTPPSFSFPSLSFTLRNTVRSRRPFLIVSAVKSLTETELLPIAEAESIPSASGVYALYDKSDELQFVGISRNIAASVSSHLKSVPELCGSVKKCTDRSIQERHTFTVLTSIFGEKLNLSLSLFLPGVNSTAAPSSITVNDVTDCTGIRFQINASIWFFIDRRQRDVKFRESANDQRQR